MLARSCTTVSLAAQVLATPVTLEARSVFGTRVHPSAEGRSHLPVVRLRELLEQKHRADFEITFAAGAGGP